MAELIFLSARDVGNIAVPMRDLFAAVEQGLVSQSRGTAIAEPTVSFQPLPGASGLVSVIRGALTNDRLAMVKTVGTFPNNHVAGLVTNPGLITLMDAETGMPQGIVDASLVTTMRTAAVTAIGAKYLARKDAEVLGCIGSRGIVPQAARFIAELFDLSEIRIYSPNKENRDNAVRELSEDLTPSIVAHKSWSDCLDNADIMIDGSSLKAHQELFPVDVLSPGATLIAYGACSSMPIDVLDRIDRIVMDRWVHGDSGETGAFGPHVASGRLRKHHVGAMIGDVISGDSVGRSSSSERVLFWHRGVAACDIVLVKTLIERAETAGIGQRIEI